MSVSDWSDLRWQLYQDQPGDYLLYEAMGEDGTVLGALVYWLDTTTADRAEGHRPWNATIFDSLTDDFDEAEDIFLDEVTDGNIVDDLGAADTYDEAVSILLEAIGK